MPHSIIPNNPPGAPTKGYDSPAEGSTKPSIVVDSGGPIQSTTPLPSSDPLSVELMPEGQAEMSLSEKALIALRRAGEAKKPIERKNTWKGAVSKIKCVMDTVSPIAEVRAISILPLLD